MSQISPSDVSIFFKDEVDSHIIYYFRDFLSAILNVDKRYLYYTDTSNLSGEDIKYVLQVERSFTYELYHQWSMLLEDYNPLKLMINSEISKFLGDKEDCRAKQPDFVLHKSQTSPDNLLIVGEVKSIKYYHASGNRYDAVKDIIKLLGFLNGRLYKKDKIDKNIDLSYKYAFFLVYSQKRENEEPFFKESEFITNVIGIVNNSISGYIKEESLKKLFLIAYSPDSIKITTLHEIINEGTTYYTYTKGSEG